MLSVREVRTRRLIATKTVKKNDKTPCGPRVRKGFPVRVADAARTRDLLNHNQVLYQLSYSHHVQVISIM